MRFVRCRRRHISEVAVDFRGQVVMRLRARHDMRRAGGEEGMWVETKDRREESPCARVNAISLVQIRDIAKPCSIHPPKVLKLPTTYLPSTPPSPQSHRILYNLSYVGHPYLRLYCFRRRQRVVSHYTLRDILELAA